MLQRDLERVFNLGPGVASQYERGLREPGFDMLLSIAEFFDVTADFLLGRKGAVRDSLTPHAKRRRIVLH